MKYVVAVALIALGAVVANAAPDDEESGADRQGESNLLIRSNFVHLLNLIHQLCYRPIYIYFIQLEGGTEFLSHICFSF